MKRPGNHLHHRMWSSLTYRFDRAVSGTVIKQFGVLLTVFICLYLLWLGISLAIPSHYQKMINKEIPAPQWSVIAQMIDPGNQHMVGVPDTLSQTMAKNIVALPDSTGQAISSQIGAENLQSEPNNWIRLLVLLISMSGTIVFGGLLISTITNVFEQRVNIVREGLMNYHYKDHIVILGCNKIIIGLLAQLIRKPQYQKSKIVLLTTQSVPEVKRSLMSELPVKELKRIHILAGERTSMKDINRLWLPFAKEVYILGENNEPDHDSQNNASLNMIESSLKDHYKNAKMLIDNYPKILNCNVLFNSQTTYVAHQFLNFQKLKENGKREDSPVNINSFSFYEKWAQKVFVGGHHKEIIYSPLDFEPIPPESDKYVHVIIAGMSRMGFAIGLEAARLGHFANFDRKKTKITFIDAHADREIHYFGSRFQDFYNAIDVNYHDLLNQKHFFKQGGLPFIDLELNVVNGHFESPEVRELLLNWTADPNALTTIAICFNDPGVCLAAGLYLPNEIYSRKLRVIVQQEAEDSILSLLYADNKKVDNRYENVKAFGMIDNCLDLSLHSDFKAKAINYFYYSYSLLSYFDASVIKEMNEGWQGLRERFKWSSRYNAESIPTKLRAIGTWSAKPEELNSFFTTDHIELLARIEHARWNIDVLLAGFSAPSDDIALESMRTADLAWEALQSTEDKDKALIFNRLKSEHENYVETFKRKMIHPCLVPYEKLSEFYKDIDKKLVKCIPVLQTEYVNKNMTIRLH